MLMKSLGGGTGYKLYDKNLPEYMEHIFPDYSIYPQYDYAIGFLTRGCIRSCPWCVVPKKEGKICAYDTWQHIKRPDSNKIVFMDNNVLASDHGVAQIEEMSHEPVRIDFNQGLDARLIDREKAKYLAKCKWIKYLRVACDTSAMLPVIKQALAYLGEYGLKPYKVWSYVLIEDIEDAHHRIIELDKMGVTPFAQAYMDFDGGKPDKLAKKMERWCNMKAVFRSCTWEEYKWK